MAVKVMMKRVPNPGVWLEMNEVLRELRMLAMTQPGYISGETVLSATEQGTTLVISTWSTVNDWREYEDSPERKALLNKLGPLLAQPATTDMWVESPVVG